MDFLKTTYNNMMPRSLWDWRDSAEQTVLSTKKAAVSLLCAACSVQTGSDVSELPYYGLSPPVYPSRNSSPFFPIFPCTLTPATNTQPKQSAMAPPTPAGRSPTATPETWSHR